MKKPSTVDVVASIPSAVVEQFKNYVKQKGGNVVIPGEYFGAPANPGYVAQPTFTVTSTDTPLAREGLTMGGGYYKKIVPKKETAKKAPKTKAPSKTKAPKTKAPKKK